MPNHSADTSQRTAAIIAGLGIILMILPAVFANFVVLEGLIVPGDAAATVNNIQANESQFNIGILCFFIVVVLDVLVAWALYVFFKPVNQSLSMLTGWFRMVYATIYAISLLYLVSAVRLVTGAGNLTLFGADQMQSQVMLSLNQFRYGWDIALIFFGLHLVFLGYLVFISGYVRKILGILVIVAGVGYLIDSLASLFFPGFEVTISQFTFIGELLLAIWLLVKGFNAKTWDKGALKPAG